MNGATNRRQTATALTELAQQPVSIELPAHQNVRSALQDTSLRLPAGGEYVVRLSGRVLHVYEVNRGIKRYTFSDQQEVRGMEVDNGQVTIEVRNRYASKIVLHLDPQPRPAATALLDELGVPDALLQEYARLRAKARPTTADIDRKRELFRQLGKAFAEVATGMSVTKPSSSYIRPSGESARGIGGSG